ncbi:hypothetical protein BLNAU_10266 [Blattamonas nauphoetae]|uniref:Uncharacterized protein n=1 Tax=Blattamonas nauphoetae TaxID=2049346 RepID=A0ABQ9XTG9_9EUKA|nr:hypothetical protein BLNAU_10266 [Blattamonas nauphoetae]
MQLQSDSHFCDRQMEQLRLLGKGLEPTLQKMTEVVQQLSKSRILDEQLTEDDFSQSKREEAAALSSLNEQIDSVRHAETSKQNQRTSLLSELSELLQGDRRREEQDAELIKRETQLNLRMRDLDDGGFLRFYQNELMGKQESIGDNSLDLEQLADLEKEATKLQQQELDDLETIEDLEQKVDDMEKEAKLRAIEQQKIVSNLETEKRLHIRKDREVISSFQEKLTALSADPPFNLNLFWVLEYLLLLIERLIAVEAVNGLFGVEAVNGLTGVEVVIDQKPQNGGIGVICVCERNG